MLLRKVFWDSGMIDVVEVGFNSSDELFLYLTIELSFRAVGSKANPWATPTLWIVPLFPYQQPPREK
jgi:hypothetical protein